MGAGGYMVVTNMDKDAVALVIVLTVHLSQQELCVADLTSNAAAWHCLKVSTCAERLRRKLLHRRY